jgi:hypothetical protein
MIGKSFCRRKNTFGICLWTGACVILLSGFVSSIPWINSHRFQTEWLPESDKLPLGSEYFYIGKSLAEGRGFTSPFRVASGPTAWMPPGLPILIGTLYTITGRSEFWTAVLFHWSGVGCVVMAWWYILRFSVLAGIAPLFITIGFFVCLYAQWQDVFRSTHDAPFLMFMAAWILLSCFTIGNQSISSAPTILSTLRWGSLGGLTSLLSPALLVAWLVCTAMLYLQRRRHLVLAVLVMLMIQSPWIIRNYLCFGQLVPIKSNAAFEAALASRTPTGLLTPLSFSGHPYVDEQEAIRHAELGEIEYIRVRVAEMRSSVDDQPVWLYQVVQRAKAYLAVSTSWMSSRSQAFCYGIPFFLCLVHLALGKFDRLPMACVLAVWFGYGSVYILVSYYERYSAPMVPVRCLCVALGLQSLWKSRESVGGLWHR